jgi:hypothetical protein
MAMKNTIILYNFDLSETCNELQQIGFDHRSGKTIMFAILFISFFEMRETLSCAVTGTTIHAQEFILGGSCSVIVKSSYPVEYQ